ncbi:MAG: WD40 repeat domain-containing serine/threonine protein kinase, partial [Gemmataceae bacterium]
GFGEVWQAEGPDKKPVALKFVGVSDKAAKKELEVHSILREIQHPHIVRVHETWITEHAVVLAMEMAQESLQDRLRECPQGLPEDELKGYMVGIADALTMLHQRGIQHRDVKPSNLLLVDGVVKLADFGISRQFANSRTGHTGLLTAQYSPPEFFEGSTSKHSDQYGLAVSFCQLRGGRLPFQGSIAQIIAGHLSKKPDLSMLPERERSAVAIALEKNPEQRWPSCSAFMDAILKGTQTGPARVPVSRRDWLKWGVGGAASLAAVGGMIVARNRLVNGPRLETLSFEPFYHYTSPQTVRSIAHGALQDESLPFILFLNGTGGPTLLNAQTGEVVRRFPMPGGPGAALAPFDIAEGLSSHEKGEIILWDLLKGKEIRPFRNQKASVSAIAYSPDGRQVLSGATDDAVRLFDRKTGEELQCLRGHTGFVMSVAFSTTGTHAFSGSWDGTVRIWNLRTGAMEQTLSGHSSRVWSIGQSWNGKWLISGGQDHLINAWDSVTGSHHLRIESEASVNSVLSVTPNLILVGTNT